MSVVWLTRTALCVAHIWAVSELLLSLPRGVSQEKDGQISSAIVSSVQSKITQVRSGAGGCPPRGLGHKVMQRGLGHARNVTLASSHLATHSQDAHGSPPVPPHRISWPK